MDWIAKVTDTLGPGAEADAIIERARHLPHGQACRLAHWVAGLEAGRKGKGGCTA